MKYNQPFDATDPTGQAPYINGNPAASIPGSIPPAAAFEHPQREIVAVLAEPDDAVPSANDLKQLLKAIRGGKLTTFVASGTANALAIAPRTPHTILFRCLPFRVFPTQTNTQSEVILTVNGSLSARIWRNGGGTLQPGDIEAGCPFDVVHDGQKFQLMGPGRTEIPRIVRDEIIWVSIDGDDSADGRTQATALRTIGAALIKATRFYLFGAPLPIYLAKPGEYPWPTIQPDIAGAIQIRANPANTANQAAYVISGVGGGGRGGVVEAVGFSLSLIGVRVLNKSTDRFTVAASNGGQVGLTNVTLDSDQPLSAYALYVSGGGSSAMVNNGCVWASSSAGMMAARKGDISISTNALLTVTGNPAWSDGAAVVSDGGTITGRAGSSIAGTATGKRYNIASPGIIRVTSTAPDYFPGNTPGTITDSAGRYFS